ncbi:MAG: MFS transporter [Eubacteriales bacterium]
MEKQRNRYLILFAAAIVNFSYGSAYIWSVFQPAAKEKFGLEASSANRPFNVFMGFFVLGNILGGKLQQKLGTRLTILLGSFWMCFGFLLTAFIPVNMPYLLSITYGIMGGCGAGIAYNALIAGTQKWFPDKRGMVTGIIICTVGAPGLIMTPILNTCIAAYGFSHSMMLVALIYFAICFGLGWLIVAPPEGYAEQDIINSANRIPDHGFMKKQYSTSEILRTKQYYLITGAMMLAVPAYFLINPMMLSLGVERGLTEALAISGVMISSILNISGRLIAPWISDKVGSKVMLILLFAVSMGSVLTLIIAEGFVFILCVALVSFSYGGFFGIFPVIVVDYFGTKYSGMNYGMVMIGYGIVSILCPNIVAMGIGISFAVAGVACVLGMICTLLMKKSTNA